MANPEFGQSLNIALEAPRFLPTEEKKEPKVESVDIPFLKGVKLKISEGAEVNFGDKSIKQKIKDFVKDSIRYAELSGKKEQVEVKKNDIRDDLVSQTEEEDWWGVEVEKKNFGTTIFLGDSFVPVKKKELVEKGIPEEYRSQLLVVKERPPAPPPPPVLLFDYKLYRELVKKGKIPRLPKQAIGKPPWRIKVSFLHFPKIGR